MFDCLFQLDQSIKDLIYEDHDMNDPISDENDTSAAEGPQPSIQQEEDGPSPSTSRAGPSRRRGEELIEHQKLMLLQQMSASVLSKPAPDAHTSFGNLVAVELRLIKNVAIQTNVKRKIMNALFEAQEADQCNHQPPTHLLPAPYPTYSASQTPHLHTPMTPQLHQVTPGPPTHSFIRVLQELE